MHVDATGGWVSRVGIVALFSLVGSCSETASDCTLDICPAVGSGIGHQHCC